MSKDKIHYDEKYFEWQKSAGEFAAKADRIKFEEYVKPEFNVLDFGCGGGFMISSLNCAQRMGVEINPTARKSAESKGVTTFETSADVPDGWADLIISDNALEHTHHPLDELKNLLPKLKKTGTAVFIVPCESLNMPYDEEDINQHLYSWSPLCIGNLFKLAGYNVISSDPFHHKWPRKRTNRIMKTGGPNFFNLACKMQSHFDRDWHNVKVVSTPK